MAELWDLVASTQKQQQHLDEQVKALAESCKASHHEVRHILECLECYGKLVDAMRARYLESTEEEWFSGRKAFLRELDRMFSDAKEFKTHLKDIEARITKERDHWLRLRIKASTIIPVLAEKSMSQAEFKAKIMDPAVEPKDLLAEILNAAPVQELRTETADRLQQLSTVSSEERPRLLRDLIIPTDLADAPESLEISKQLDDNVALSTAFKGLLLKRDAAVRKEKEAKQFEKRLDELRRAQAAHHAQLEKNRARQEARSHPGVLQNSTNCEACSKDIDRVGASFACQACLILVEAHVKDKAAVYCSQQCAEKAQNEHCAKCHQCASAETCVRSTDDQDTVMSGQGDDLPVLCKECTVSLKSESLFCSKVCAATNFQQHRDKVHIPLRTEKESKVDDGDALIYDNIDRTQYHAKDIAAHILHLDDEEITSLGEASSEIRVKT